jgi:hypothetical protein
VTRLTLLALAGSTLFAPALVAGANSHPPALAVSAWPARVVVTAPGSATVEVGNPGSTPATLVVRPRGYALDALGRPKVKGASSAWLSVRPARLVVAAHGLATLRVQVRRPAGARPGDHAQLLLLSTEPPAGHRVVARLRVGIVVVARVPGRLVHRLRVARVRVRHRARQTRLEVVVVNRGNVDEWLGRGRVSLTLARSGGRPLRLSSGARRLLARSSGIVEARVPPRLHGRLTVVVAVRRPAQGAALARWRYRLRL